MAAVYHSVISTVKLQSKLVWDYLGKFFRRVFNGCRDFFQFNLLEYRFGFMLIVKKQMHLYHFFVRHSQKCFTKGDML